MLIIALLCLNYFMSIIGISFIIFNNKIIVFFFTFSVLFKNYAFIMNECCVYEDEL